MVIKSLLELQFSRTSTQSCARTVKNKAENFEHDREYLRKDIYLQKKDRKSFMILDLYKSIVMEYQKLINLLDNTANQTSKFRTRDWVETNDDSRITCNTNNQTIFKTSMQKLSSYDWSDVYVLVKSIISVANTAAAGTDTNNLIYCIT